MKGLGMSCGSEVRGEVCLHNGNREILWRSARRRPAPTLIDAPRQWLRLTKNARPGHHESEIGSDLGKAVLDDKKQDSSEQALKKSEARFQRVVESAPHAMVMINREGVIEMVNAQAERVFGYKRVEMLGQPVEMLVPERFRRNHPGLRRGFFADPQARPMGAGRDLFGLKKDGSEFPVEIGLSPIETEAGTMVLSSIVDISSRQQLEERLRQSQKMEAIGQLTGGIAHDFNNALTVIAGNIDMIQLSGVLTTPLLQRALDAASRGVEQAATLTHRLLAFSRLQPLDPKAVDLTKVVTGMSDMLTRTLGEIVAVEIVLARGLWWVWADESQLENALLNLALNARDAMPEGGKLTIETANIHLDEAYTATQAELTPGEYAMVAVSDSGIGMSQKILGKAFEPFFTTKELGQGTGLGLSQVYGFIKQSRGNVNIYSEPGVGTTVKIYLPRLPGDHFPVQSSPEIKSVATGTSSETILVVEDDDNVRAYAVNMLCELGYRVLEAHDGQAALRVLEAEPAVDLLFTDVGLPGGLNGRQLANEILRRRPGLRILFTTGYARNAIVHQGRLDPDVELLTKPFTYSALAAKIRYVLDSKRSR